MSMLIDIGAIKDEDLLRRMWQDTDDFCRKKEIRAHMYKLRETRLRDFYSGDMDAGIGLSKTPLTASHGDSLADQSFQSFKTKEIRDSESPTREFKYGVPANLGGWNIMTSSELSNDGKMHTTHSLATTGGVHDLTDGQAKFTGRNEKISSVAFDGDDKNFTTSSGENSNTVLEENIVQGDENNRRVENKKSTVTTSSKVIRSHYESGDNDYEPRYDPSETIERKLIYNEAPQPRVTPQQAKNNVPLNISPPLKNNSEQLISRTVEYPDPHTKVIREVKSLPDGSTITTTKYETRSANSEVWTSSNSSKNTSSSTSRITKDDRAENNRIQYIIDDRGNQVPYQPSRHIQNKTTKDIEGYEIIIDTTNDRNAPINKNVKKDLARDMERMTDQDDVIRTTTTTTTKTNRNNDVYDVKRPTVKDDKKPIETEYTRKRISVDLDPTHEAFARSLRCVSPVSDRDSIRSHRSTTSSIRSSISPEKGFRSRRSNSRDTDISQISSQTVTKCGPTPGLKSPQQRVSPTKRPDITTTTTTKTEKIIRVPKDEKPDKHTPRQKSQVTDLDSDDTIETKTTVVTSTTIENKDRPKSNRPPFVRSETYEERCRKILGMPEPDDQSKSPNTRRSKFTATTTDFIENEKIDIVKNRTISTERSKPKSPENNPTRKPSGRPNKDEPTINTNTFDRKTPRKPENLSSVSKPMTGQPGGEIIETTVNRSVQRRPNGNIPGDKSPSRVSPDRRSPSKLVETVTSTITRKTPRGTVTESPVDQSPDRTTINSEPLDRKPSKIVETTKTIITRETPRRPSSERDLPDRKSPHRRPTTEQGSPDRKTATIKNVKNVEKHDIEINETIIGHNQPKSPVDGSPERKSPNRRTTVTETITTRKTPRPTKQPGGPDTDEELIDESEPEYETIDRKLTQRPTDELESDDVTNRPHTVRPKTTYTTEDNVHIKSKSIISVVQRKHRDSLDNESEYLPETEEDTPYKPNRETDEEIIETVVTETLLNRKQPLDQSPDRCTPGQRPSSRPVKVTKEIIETTTDRTYTRPGDKTHRPTATGPDYDAPNRPSKIRKDITEIRKATQIPKDTEPNYKSPNDSERKTPVRQLPDRPTNSITNVTESDDETTKSTIIRKPSHYPDDEDSDGRFPNRSTKFIEKTTETTITRKSPHNPNDVQITHNVPDRRSPDRPSKFTTNVNKTDREYIESSTTRQTQRRPIDKLPDSQPLDVESDEETTIKSSVIHKTQPRPNEESPDRQTPERKTTSRFTPDRKPSAGRPTKVTEEITEKTTIRKLTHQPPNDVPSNRKVPDRKSPDRPSQFTTNVIEKNKITTDNTETDEDTIESTIIYKTKKRPNDESPDRQSPDRKTTDQITKEHPSRVAEEITETVITRKSPQHSNDVPSDRKVPDRRSPDRPSKITTSVNKTDREIVESSTTRQTYRRPNDQLPDRPFTTDITESDEETIESPCKTTSRSSPVRETPGRPSKITEEITESTITRKSPPNDIQSTRNVPGRKSPDHPSKFTTNVDKTDRKTIKSSVTRETRRHPNNESPDGQLLDIVSDEETTVNSSVIRKTPFRPNDESPDRQSPDRKTTSRSTPDRKISGRPSNVTEEITETTTIRKLPHQSTNDVPSNRNVPDRRSPDRPSKFTRNVIQTNKETIESSTIRQTHRRPSNQSPDRQSPGRTVSDRPFNSDVTETDEEIIESTKIRKTQLYPGDEPPDRQSPDRKTTNRYSPERGTPRRSPDHQTTSQITESIISRKIPCHPDDATLDHRSPNAINEKTVKTTTTRKTPERESPERVVVDRRSPSRPMQVTEEITETSVIRKIPGYRSPDRKTTIQSTRSPERLSKVTRNITETDQKITETTHIRKTNRQPTEDSPYDRSPSSTIPNHRSPGSKNHINVTETITTKKSSTYPENVPFERKISNRQTTSDRSSKNVDDQEVVEKITTRKIQRRPNDDSPERHSPSRKNQSPDRKSSTKVIETKITRKTPRQSEQSPDRLYKTTTNRTDTDEEYISDRSPERQSPVRKTIDRPERPSKITKHVTETVTTAKSQRYPTTQSPDRKNLTDKRPSRTSDNTSPIRPLITKSKNDEEFTETITTRKIKRQPFDESPDRKTPGRLTNNSVPTIPSKRDMRSPDRTLRRPTDSPTPKTTTTVTKITSGRRPTPSYTDDTAVLRPKPMQKSPEEIVESDEPTDEPTNKRRVDTVPGYLRQTQASRPKTQSPDRKISTATYINETDEEIYETVVKRKPGNEHTDQNGCEPSNRPRVKKIPTTKSSDNKTSSTITTRRPVLDDKSPTRRPSRPERPVDRSPERHTSEESEIDEETVKVNQYERFIENEIHDTETNRRPNSERPGPLRRKPDDVEVIFERVVDTTNLTEVDNALVEEEREVGCKLTEETDQPKRQPKELSPSRRHQPFESSPTRRTTLKKSTKFDDDTEEITTTVERNIIRRPTTAETSPDRRQTRPTKLRSPETSPVRRNIIKTVKEIIISPTQIRRVAKPARSPETSPTRRTTHITTVTKTIPDRSTPTTPSKFRPQPTPSSQPGQRKPNLDRISSEIITDHEEKRQNTTTIKSKQKTATEIAPSIVQRYTTKTESSVARPTTKKNEIVEEVCIKKDTKKLCDGDVCGPRSANTGTPTTKRNIPKQEVPVRSKIIEKIDRFSSNTTTTQTNKRSTITERKNTAPITPSARAPAPDKFNRSASENQIRTPHTPKIDVNETVSKERRTSLKSKTARPTKCIATKTINITNTNLTVDNDEMDIIIDIQQAKSSREPSPNKMIPVPVSPETDTGPSRYPDNVTEPEDDRKPRRKVTNIPIFEEETNNFVSCDITEVSADHVPHYDDLEEGNVDESDDDINDDRIVKVTDNDECLLSVSDKVSRFINLADETVTSNKVTRKKTEADRDIIDNRRPITKELENDDCLLSVSDKVSKFIMTAEEFKKPKASTDFVTIEKINETKNRYQPEQERLETTEDEEFVDEVEGEEKTDVNVNKTNRVDARKVTKIVERKPSETVITTTTTTTTRKTKPTEPRVVDEEITVTRPKETKVSTIASKFTKPNTQLTSQSSTKRITTDTKVSSVRTKFDNSVEPDDGSDKPIDESDDRYEPDNQGREPFFLNQNGTNNQQIETISKIVQSSYVDQVPDDQQPPKGSVVDRFKPNTADSKIKKIATTPILQSTEVLKKAKQIFENKPNDRPKQIDILSRPSVWKYKTNDTKLTDIGVHTTKTTTTTEIESSDEESLVEPKPETLKTPKLSARDEFTLKNLRDVTNISSKKDLFERKFSSDRITTTTTINREFSESPIGDSPVTTPTDSQGRYITSNKPSYMNHTVSSLEHINRRDSRSQITSDHESIDDNNSINSNKFGVELRRVDSQNATKTRRKSSSTEIPCVEEIWDLELLERMLDTVVGYEHRRRIRSQIRIIKKQIEDEEIITKRITKERTRSPTNKRIETVTTTTTVPKSQPMRKLSPLRTVTKTTRVIDEPDQKMSKVVTTTTTISKSGDVTDDGKPIWMKKNLLKKPSENQIKTPSPSTTTSTSTTRKYNTSSYREVEKTDSVTSSYGIGPTDENGKPLFGIRALKKQAQKTEQPIEPVYSIDSDPYQETRKIAETINLRAPQKIREGYQSATTTVKKSTKNFIQHELDDQPESDGDEIEEYEYESNDLRAQSKIAKKVQSNVQSFLGSDKTYTGFNDVIDRMKNADHVQVEGDTESDREARTLLNKFLGASILVQATENVLPDGVKLMQKTTRTVKSDSPVVSSATRQVTTTKLTKVKSSNSNNKDSSSSNRNNNNNNNNTGAISTTVTTTAINDIDSIWDEAYLRKLLEQSSSYEKRRKIRARIRQIMADKEGGKTTTEIVKETKKDDDGGITTTTTKVTTRTVTASKPVSPFAKFRQLDKQASTQSPPNSPHTPNTPKTPGQTSAPIFKFTDPALNRRVATFKEQLLQWCQFKTREYENVKIENFSTSWSDGLAFCALIHHFRPDAFDYSKLVATQRRFNFDLAFRVADEKAGIAPLLDVEDMVVMRKPDWKCVFTYVQSIHRRFKDAD